MLLLTTTSDQIRLVTDVASTVDVHASYIDDSTGVMVPGRTNTLVTTATTTVVIGSPGSGVFRTVKTLTVRNKSTSTPVTVTVVHRASGPVDAEMISALLLPGMTLAYNEGRGWETTRAPFGAIAMAVDTIWDDAAIGAFYTHVLTEDVVQADAVANRLSNSQELRFAVKENQTFWFCWTLMYTSAATTTGSRWSVYGVGSPVTLAYQSEYSLTTTTKTSNEGVLAYDIPAASNASSAATASNQCVIEGFISPSDDGYVWPRFGNEVASSAITLKTGSILNWMRVL